MNLRLATRQLLPIRPVRTGRDMALTIAAFVGLACLNPQSASAKPALGQLVPSGQQVPMDQIDHSAFDQLLRTYVDENGYVNYAKWKSSRADRGRLLKYLQNLSRASTTAGSNRDAKMAFWINAYNAVTIEGILQEYPTTSIRNHTARVFGYNIWKELPLHVGNTEYSLEQIEHEILRKLKEPRVHFAIVCASIGCPRLRSEAYTPTDLQKQLADNATDFFSRKQNFRMSRDGRTLYFSTILDWFADDFGSSQAKRLAYLKRYLPDYAKQAASNPNVRIAYLDYDWNLNDQKPVRR